MGHVIMESEKPEVERIAKVAIAQKCEADIDFDMFLDIAAINRDLDEFMRLVFAETGIAVDRSSAGALMFERWVLLSEL